MPAVDQYEDGDEVLSFPQIVFDHFLPPLPFRQRDLCKAISRQIHDIPFVIDDKMVQQLRFARSIGGLGQFFVVGEHVDEGGFSHIAAADKGIFWLVGLGTGRVIWTADDIGG